MTPWYSSSLLLSKLGLGLVTVRKYGRAARWIACRACGRGLVALWCSDCGWNLEHYWNAYRHLAAIRKLTQLRLLECPEGCNKRLIDSPPEEILLAQAEEAAAEEAALPKRSRKKVMS
ncbi:MAG TPA: hypothetical protein VNO22_10300 [Planctomycetota bacterium]|nr:hypothetical protein [Planctomycetota bacterium]